VAEPAPDGAQRPAVLVSACLLGVACNHRGEASLHPGVLALNTSARLVPVCPEVAGGLPTPRPAAERDRQGRVRTSDGQDVTELYERGAAQAVALARATGARRAVLKARSPSCGSGQIYDGSHQRVLRPGDGVTAEALRAAGIEVCSEDDLEAADAPGRAGVPGRD
jgi:uncharacterized protein YbbK (DUF523 family)